MEVPFVGWLLVFRTIQDSRGTSFALFKVTHHVNYRNFKDYHIEQLRDPEDAKIYLSVVLEEYEKNGDIEAFLLAVRDVAEAQGGMSKLAERVSLTREGLRGLDTKVTIEENDKWK